MIKNYFINYRGKNQARFVAINTGINPNLTKDKLSYLRPLEDDIRKLKSTFTS
jgi:hypothetical protein